MFFTASPSCDTVKKARAWLSERKVEHVFHDFKKHGIPVQRLTAWEQTLGWQKLLNRQGTTWRKLDAEVLQMGSHLQMCRWGQVSHLAKLFLKR